MVTANSLPPRIAESGARSMRVLVVDEELPYPLNTGKRIRTYNLLSRLAGRHRIKILSHRNIPPGEYEGAQRRLEELGIECVSIARKLPTQSVLAHGPGFYGRLAFNLLSSRPYLVDKHRSQAMLEAVKRVEREEAFDLWHCEWTPYAQFFRSMASRPLVIAAHNVESLIWKRYHEVEPNPLKRWYIGRQLHKFRRFERWAFSRATRTVTVSDEDARLAKTDFLAQSVDVVENGVDVDSFQGPCSQRVPTQLLFVGSLDWRPNLDGVSRFLDTAFPAIRRIEPRAELHIVGRKPPAWLAKRIRSLENVQLHPDAPDVRPFFSTAGIMVVPLRIGGGSRLKILEAGAMKLPVVSTRIGAEGLDLEPVRHYVAVETIDEMAEPILNAMKDYQRSREMAAAAHCQIKSHYDWDLLAVKLEQAWRRALTPASIGACREALSQTTELR